VTTRLIEDKYFDRYNHLIGEIQTFGRCLETLTLEGGNGTEHASMVNNLTI